MRPSCTSLLCRVAFVIVFLISGSRAHERADLPDVVPDVNLSSYAGTWYEIAHLPNRHERGLSECTSTFTINSNGKIELLNHACKGSGNGKRLSLKCDVQVPDSSNTGALKVKIFKIFTVDYRIIDVDKKNYQFAMVTTNSKDNLWIISKSPVMDESVYSRLVASARGKGFQTDRLERTLQAANVALVNR